MGGRLGAGGGVLDDETRTGDLFLDGVARAGGGRGAGDNHLRDRSKIIRRLLILLHGRTTGERRLHVTKKLVYVELSTCGRCP